MRRAARSPGWIAAALICVSCGASGGGGNFDVTVRVDPAIEDRVEVVSARGDRPGATNPIDAEVVLANRGQTALRLELNGRWEDGEGGFQGGATDQRELSPGGQTRFVTGTHTTRAEAFQLDVRVATATMDERLTETLADATSKPEGHGITYTEAPTVEEIPAWTPRGVAAGAPFTAGTVLFRPTDAGWRLELSDRAFDPLGGIAAAHARSPGLQTVHLNLPREPTPGAVLRHGPDYGGGYFQVRPDPQAETTTSWNTTLTWVLEITAWNRRPWSSGGPTIQAGGTASGKVYAAFRGSEGGLPDSWISGTFEDVPIVYYGPPPGD